MVKSKINSQITYNETNKIDEEDINYETASYSFTIYGVEIEIAIGKEKYTYSKYDVVYFPIYLIVNDEPTARIGIFEIDSNRLISALDEEGDIDLTKGNVLIYVSETHLKSLLPTTTAKQEALDETTTDKIEEPKDEPEVIELSDEEEDVLKMNIPEKKISPSSKATQDVIESGIFKTTPSTKPVELLSEETQSDSDKLKREYEESPRTSWIEKFMKNNNYEILDNEGGGDCFFATIRDAFREIGKETTVFKLRSLLANEATDELYQQSRMIYMGILSEIQEKEKEMAETKKISKTYKSRIEQSKNKEEAKSLLNDLKSLSVKYDELVNDKKLSQELMREFAHMKDIDSLEKFREFIKTSRYWADTWAVSTIERLLNIKVVILSEEAYDAGDLDSVLKCGQINDDIIERQSNYSPEFYIMTSYTGNHYQLIRYKNRGIFKFQEVPYTIKTLIINKCMEKNSGPYYLIREFRNFKTRLGLDAHEGEQEESDDEESTKDLYDSDIVFCFHSKSDPHPKAGKGNGERISESKILEFNGLNRISDWRRKLDNSWLAPFTVDGHRWNSVEHYIQGAQFKKGFPDFYLQFSLDSGSDISKDVSLAKAAGGKSGKLKERTLRDKKIKVDSDYYDIGNPRSEEEYKTALNAKFTQNQDVKQILLMTGRAKLVHFVRGSPPVPDESLMSLRRDIAQVSK
jgi:transcriptional regulator with XRE-family HTH domain